jgi:hypothetical protein
VIIKYSFAGSQRLVNICFSFILYIITILYFYVFKFLSF